MKYNNILIVLGILIVSISIFFIVTSFIGSISVTELSLTDQPPSSVQLINDTSENPLHVFLQMNNTTNRWKKLSGNGSLYDPVKWGTPDALAWDPLGAKIASEAIIPKGGSIVLQIPEQKPPVFVIMAIKMKNSDDNPISGDAKRCGGVPCNVVNQQSILIEAGKDVVADASAVDGINFKIKYEMTERDGTQVMEIHKNPCEGLDKKYLSGVGCHNPAKVDCTTPTCECMPGTQTCMFNDCSQKLFNIPDNLKQYIGKYDHGNPNPPVKGLINNSNNLKQNALRQFCENIQWNSGDFTTYCYDYNDVKSSPWLRSPYKMRITYKDL